jgi:hypothetical protein
MFKIRRRIKTYLLGRVPIGRAMADIPKSTWGWVLLCPDIDTYLLKLKSKWYWKLLKLDKIN